MDVSRAGTLFLIAQAIVILTFAGTVYFDPGPPLFDAPRVRVAGGGATVAGLLLVLIGALTLGKSLQAAPVPKADGALRTSGLYGWFRHPMYTGVIAVALGLFLRQPSVLVLAALAMVVAFLVVKVRYEERLLLLKYPGYAEYRRQAWGVIPFLT